MCCINEGHNLDIIIIAAALFQLSYLARCSGIFGDEKKYVNEFSRGAKRKKKKVSSILKISYLYISVKYSMSVHSEKERKERRKTYPLS